MHTLQKIHFQDMVLSSRLKEQLLMTTQFPEWTFRFTIRTVSLFPASLIQKKKSLPLAVQALQSHVLLQMVQTSQISDTMKFIKLAMKIQKATNITLVQSPLLIPPKNIQSLVITALKAATLLPSFTFMMICIKST